MHQSFTFSETGLGIGIASKIAETGLYRDRKLEEYVNFVGMIILEASREYHQKYTFFILDDNSINAYSSMFFKATR